MHFYFNAKTGYRPDSYLVAIIWFNWGLLCDLTGDYVVTITNRGSRSMWPSGATDFSSSFFAYLVLLIMVTIYVDMLNLYVAVRTWWVSWNVASLLFFLNPGPAQTHLCNLLVQTIYQGSLLALAVK